MGSKYPVEVAETYEDVELSIHQEDYQDSIHDSLAYGLARELRNGNELLTRITGINNFNRVLPEGYSPRKWHGEVEDWVITDSNGTFCIGQSVSRHSKDIIPQIGVRKDFYQAMMFEQRVKFDPFTYDNLSGVFVINLDEDYTNRKEFQNEIDRELYKTGKTDLSVVIHELEASTENSLENAGRALEYMASD